MKPATMLTQVIVTLIAVLHLARLIVGTAVTVNGLEVPVWGSAIGAVFFGVLAVGLWREHHPPRA
jgi:hypothetical protein